MHKYVHVMICHCQGLSAAGVSLQSANFVGPHSIALIFSNPQSLRNRFFFHRYLNRGRGTTRHTSQTRGTTRFIFFSNRDLWIDADALVKSAQWAINRSVGCRRKVCKLKIERDQNVTNLQRWQQPNVSMTDVMSFGCFYCCAILQILLWSIPNKYRASIPDTNIGIFNL